MLEGGLVLDDDGAVLLDALEGGGDVEAVHVDEGVHIGELAALHLLEDGLVLNEEFTAGVPAVNSKQYTFLI